MIAVLPEAKCAHAKFAKGAEFRKELKDGKEYGEEGEGDAGDGRDAKETVFDLSEELGVGGFVGAGGEEGDGCEVAGRDAGDVVAGSFRIEGDGGGVDETGIDEVAAGGARFVAIAECADEVCFCHGTGIIRLGGCVEVELDASVEVALAAVLPLGVFAGVVDALTVELEPGKTALDVGDGWVRSDGELMLQGLHGGVELVVGCIAEGSSVIEG